MGVLMTSIVVACVSTVASYVSTRASRERVLKGDSEDKSTLRLADGTNAALVEDLEECGTVNCKSTKDTALDRGALKDNG